MIVRELSRIPTTHASHSKTPRSLPGNAAQICLTTNLSEFCDFWPRSNDLKDARCHAFQCADILEVRCDTLAVARKTKTLFVAIVDAEKRPLMLLPLGIERRYGVRILGFLDGGLSDYNSPVVYPATRDWNEEDVRIIWREVRKILPSFDIALLEKMPDRIGDLANPLSLLYTGRFPMSGHARMLSGTLDDSAPKRLSVQHRRDYRRMRRRLEERGKLSLEISTSPEQSGTILEALVRQKLRRHRETLTRPELERLGYHSFVTEATDRLGTPGPVHLSALKSGDTIIAVSWGFVVGSRYYGMIQSSEGDSWRPFAPGHVLLEHLMEWCLDHGITIFDFGVGDEGYKLDYCDLEIVLHVANVPVTLRGVAYGAGLKAVESLKTRHKKTRVGSVIKTLLRGRQLKRSNSKAAAEAV